MAGTPSQGPQGPPGQQQPPPGWWQASDGNWYPPQGAQVAPPRQGGQGSGCLKAFLIALAVGAGLLILVVILIAIGVGEAEDEAEESAAKTCEGFSYPDQQKLDHCANAGGTVENFGLTVMAVNFRRIQDPTFAQPVICADVSYRNRDDETKNFNVFDWKLQTPSGRVQSFELTGATLHSGQIVAGGTTSGSVCFEDTGERGQFVLIWKPDPVRSDRGTCVVTL